MSGKSDDVIYERTFCTLTRILGGKQCVITCLQSPSPLLQSPSSICARSAHSMTYKKRKKKSCSYRPKMMIVFMHIHDYISKFIYSEKAITFCKISTLLLTGTTQDKSKVKISQNFVALSEYMNFNEKQKRNPKILNALSNTTKCLAAMWWSQKSTT